MKTLTLILPDLHHKVDLADKIIKKVGADKVICTGDIFDDFVEDPHVVRNSAEWFVRFVNNPNHILVCGNHDIMYAFPQGKFECSGFAQWKQFMINDIVSRTDWDKMSFYHVLDDKWLLTHAGLHKHWVPKEIQDLHTDRSAFLEAVASYLDEEIIKGFRGESWVFHAGRARGGSQRVGGIVWDDFNDEFHPITGLNQIFGHTPQEFGFPKVCHLKNDTVTYYAVEEWKQTKSDLDDVDQSFNIDLDVWENFHWATWNGEKLKFFNRTDDL